MSLDVAWAAGLLEGEACFDIRPSNALKRDPNNKQVRVIVEMKDEDVLLKLRAIFGGSVVPVNCPSKQRANWSPYFKWQLSNREAVMVCIMAIYDYMSQRRQQKLDEILYFLERKLSENIPD